VRPQETTLTSATGLDAAGDELAAASPAALEAASWPAPSKRNVLSLLKIYWFAFQERRQRARLRVSLRDLSDRELLDIGLTPGDIDCIDAHRAIEKLRDGTTYLWM
jgi:uncharacterized protein YjiS (DUF1127 family)